MFQRYPLRLDCQADPEGCDAHLYMQWPSPVAWWGPEDLQASIEKEAPGWTLYDVSGAEAGTDGEACCILACPECSKAIGDGFAAPPAPSGPVEVPS